MRRLPGHLHTSTPPGVPRGDMSSQAAPMAQERDTPISVGERAPQFTLSTVNSVAGRIVGESVTLADLIARGQVVVEFLRGTW